MSTIFQENTLASFHLAQKERPITSLKFCIRCRMSVSVCYCEHIRPFDAGPLIVTLVHPRENRKRIGTNRIVQLGIKNSLRIQATGEALDGHPEIDRLVTNPHLLPMVLYPGKNALDLDSDASLAVLEASLGASQAKRLLVFVIDGTWDLAKQMLHRSRTLQGLPQIKFNPNQPSAYRIRKQPHPVCLSTVEAVYTLLDRLDQRGLYPVPERAHGHLLRVFGKMVERQLEFQKLN